ncbi:hypothetical protein BpHYR1_036653 [Brachionus plicatilis]|uniref:Uncharacterized protein n=1 Tax=Brachionus plicatilis TaxID=10195 RepID=A0A3M7SMY4_BRAPC|nr:hypothetical protein BpHYR1_036653 [Brachionus plicatilis]
MKKEIKNSFTVQFIINLYISFPRLFLDFSFPHWNSRGRLGEESRNKMHTIKKNVLSSKRMSFLCSNIMKGYSFDFSLNFFLDFYSKPRLNKILKKNYTLTQTLNSVLEELYGMKMNLKKTSRLSSVKLDKVKNCKQ